MTIDELREHLREIERIPSERRLQSLDERKRKELEFHDRDRDRAAGQSLDQDTYEKFYGNKKYYGTTQQSRQYLDRWIAENGRGKVFLDYACGNGELAIQAAKAGAKLAIGLDISPVSVENARSDARAAGVESNTYFIQADAENTKLPADSVDSVVCSGMLHHLDLSFAFPELRRILAPGGRILALEALDYNPAIKIYRYVTPQMRTEWEKAHILSLADVRFAKRFFEIGEVRYWHITSIAGAFAKPLLPALDAVDRLLTKLPLVKYLAWMFTFELIKPASR